MRRRVTLYRLVLVGTTPCFRADPSLLQRFMAGEHHLAFGPEAPAGLIELSWRQWEKGDPATALATFAVAAGYASRGRLGDVTLPTLVVCGTEDRFTPPALLGDFHSVDQPGTAVQQADKRHRVVGGQPALATAQADRLGHPGPPAIASA